MGPRPAGLLVLLLVTAALYAPLGFAGFAWDDEGLVVGNTVTGSLAHAGAWFRSDLWTTGAEPVASGYYRPLMLASLWLDQLLWGDSPAGHHLHGVAWHLGAVAALWWLLRQLAPEGALAGAALFALHPVQSEAVAWVVARNDVMAAALGLLGCALLAPRSVGRGRLLGGFLALSAACLSKEHAALLVLLVPLSDVARFRRPGSLDRWAAAGAAVLVFLALRQLAGVATADLPALEGLALLRERPLALPTWLAGRILWPWPLSVGGTLEYLAPRPARSLLLLAAVTLAAGLLLRRGRGLACAGLAVTAATFAPALLPLLSRGQLGERYLYLPLLGLALALAAAWPARNRWAPIALLPAALMALGVAARVPDWRSGEDLWRAAVAATPNGHAYANLGFELLRRGEQREAELWLERALGEEPPFRDACLPWVLGPLRRGQVALAGERARLGRARGCFAIEGFPGTYASAVAQTGRWDLAEEALEAAAPDDARAGIVEAALAVRAGDRARLEAVAERFGRSREALEGTARELLAAAGWSGVEEAP